MQQTAKVSTGTAQLDRFGRAIIPKYFSNIEAHKAPQSRQKLTLESASLLKEYLATAGSGLLVPQIVHSSAVILWLMDSVGNVWFCIEEMYKANAQTKVMPRMNTIDYPAGYEKLGHPSLIKAKKARIAGEIIWAPGSQKSKPRWIISNRSGRYGIRPEIKKEHLDAVNELFASYGLELDPYYIPCNE